MRKTGYFISFVLCVVASVGITTMNVDKAYGQESLFYLGEHCWEGGGGFLRLGLTHMGDGHVSFSGLTTDASSDWAMNGSLEVVGNSIMITSTESAALIGGFNMFSRVAATTLDLSTLDGTSYFMEMNWEGGVCSLDHYSFNITYVDCGSDQSSDGVDKREELIRFLRKFATTPEENLD